MENRKHIFTPTEKKFFLEILKKYKAIIENKDTDGASLRHKNETWNQITAEYNASPHASTQATNKQLRRLWMNLKQRQREALTKERQHRMATGGGPSISDATIDPDVAEVVPALIVGIDTATDSDAVLDITEDPMVQPVYIDEITVAASLDPFQVVTAAPPQVSTPTSVAETAPTVVPNEQRPVALTGQRHKDSILEREFKNRQIRANEKHEVEMKVLHEQLREAKAKADLAELILQQKTCSSDLIPENYK